MINTRKDMLNAKHEVSADNFQWTWRRFHNEGRQGRHNPGHLRRAVETFNPHKHVGECGSESLDADSGTGQTSLTPNAPLFGVSIVGKKAVRLFEIGAGLGELDVEAQPHGIAHCRHFPEYVVAVWACLMELEVAGAYF